MVEGFRWMAKIGVLPIFTNLRVPPGSIYGEDISNRDKLPPTDLLLELALGHHAAMMDYGLYQKLNKFMKCGLCHDGAYKGEIGIIALAGDPGKWMADMVPYEMNKRAQFIDSIKAPTTA